MIPYAFAVLTRKTMLYLVLTLLVSWVTVLAQEKPAELMELSPMPVEETKVAGRPDLFDGRGRIDRISGWDMVIGDRLRNLSDETLFFTVHGVKTTLNHFKKGDMVGYTIGKKGAITALYRLK